MLKAPVKKLSIHDAELMRLGHKFTAYLRHCYKLGDVSINYADDSGKELQEAGFSRTRRMDFNTGTLGDVPYRVTFYVNDEEGLTAFGCNPRMQTARHRGDMVIMIPTKVFTQAMNDDTMGGSSTNEFYTITRLLWAKQFGEWYRNIKRYVRKFAGLIEE